MDKIKLLAGAFILLFATSSQGVPIQGSFTGEIYSSSERTVTVRGNSWNIVNDDALLGEFVTGAFSFDTDDLTTDWDSNPDVANYEENGDFDWLNITFEVNGTTYENSDREAMYSGHSYDQVRIEDDFNSSDGERDYLFIQEYLSEESFTRLHDIWNSQKSYLKIFDFTGIDFIDGLLLEQTITITDFSDFDGASGGFKDYHHDYDRINKYYNSGNNFRFNFNLTSFTMTAGSSAPTPAPEPSILALMFTGLFGLGLARYKYL
ncbi:MAG: PEP-CTERM sorting domain-containing protein [Gammaproteobacteria bacterium]|jgi:hypothetical protein|nr:PEP-CTERM sorting domain-containing protein [Gammaproteobacteria bacterium]MBT4075275.1 PEP-CTERM sorting domain-containing protein [Gammaproteobacteria bacterium]MBT4196321.1 PEP-CTERM sorting domain-containing protein [Gammaproteobacteria bacterium]MBT4451283.1 PEP-CTERM sorting domain-containing protein [Gammaproteobacteria bacterium]MBT4859174.1 PEP-CTERM sorting domain-containing protein [Gammaproteobacteria bacterium]